MTEGKVAIAMDYDDFNNQHTLNAQAMVFKVLFERTDIDSELMQKIPESFHKMYIKVDDKLELFKHSLMTGHRATSFLNSILNAAYIRTALGKQLYESFSAVHVGDDVMLGVNGFKMAGHIVDTIRASKIKMNPTKQSCGIYCAEFLRMACSRRQAYGYITRCVASAVSGNWLTTTEILGKARIDQMVMSARALINRSGGNKDAGRCLAIPASRRSGIKASILSEIFSGDVALNNGPIYTFKDVVKRYVIHTEDKPVKIVKGLHDHATTAYLQHHITPIERKALELSGSSLRTRMVAASYSKRRGVSVYYDPVRTTIGQEFVRIRTGRSTSDELIMTYRREGVLMRYPLLPMLARNFTNDNTRILLNYIGLHAHDDEIKTVAWGEKAKTVVIDGYLPFSDAAMYSAKSSNGIIAVTYNVFL
jgi:hypothetical protein